jgi:molecular chaperone DnaJ
VPSHLDAEATKALEEFAAKAPKENPRAEILQRARR